MKTPTAEQMMTAAEWLAEACNGEDRADCQAVAAWLKSGPKIDRMDEMAELAREATGKKCYLGHTYFPYSSGQKAYLRVSNFDSGYPIAEASSFDELRAQLLAKIAEKNAPPLIDNIPADQLASVMGGQ